MSEYLDRPRRNLVEYADELRERADDLAGYLLAFRLKRPDDCLPANELSRLKGIKRQLLAVERQINWKMCI